MSGSERPPATSRREFLAGAGTAGVAAAGAAYLTRTLHGTRLPAPAPSPTARVALVRPLVIAKPASADWRALRRHLSTRRLLRPRENGYDLARQLFEPRFDALEPAGIAYCGTAADVAACLSFVRRFKLPVRVRSGGHSYAGWSTVTGGLVIDVSPMNSVTFAGQTVTVGAGLDLVHFYTELAASAVAVPAGTGPTVGIAGLALGGGLGPLSRLHGTTSDNMTAADLVTADGNLITCDDTRNGDVLWACRGGGGGNFGVATALTFRTYPLTMLCAFTLSWPWPAAAAVLAGWQNWAPFAPDALGSSLRFSAQFGASPVLTVTGTYAGPPRALTRHLDRLYEQVGSAPATVVARQTTFLDAMLIEAGCAGIGLDACHPGAGGKLARVPSFARSDFFTVPLKRRAIRALISSLERVRGIRGAAGGVGSVTFDALGGAVNRVAAQATAFVHRNALFLAQYSTTWASPGARAGVQAQHAWLQSCYQALHRHASGQAYQNYVDPALSDWQQAYYGENYPWLTLVKQAIDPDNLFQFPQSIQPG